MDNSGLLEIHSIALCIVFDLDGVRRCGKEVIKSRKLKGGKNYLVEKKELMRYSILYSINV